MQNTKKTNKYLVFGLIAFVLLFSAIVAMPARAEADFFDDFVDFLDPTQHIGNILDGRPQDNLPPIPFPNFSDNNYNDYVTTNYYYYDLPQICQDPSASNYGDYLPCTYPPQVCQDPSAINYYGTLPCRYPAPTCQDPSAINYRGGLPCRYQQICQDQNAINYRGTLPCRYQNYNRTPTVTIDADDTSIDFEDSTRIRWDSDNADYCNGSGGTNGWSGNRNTSGSFNTGSLSSDKTYRITCYNNSDSASDSVTVRVDEDSNDDDIDEPDVTTRNATNITTGSATLNGRIDGNGSSVRAWFEYGTNTSFGYSTSQNSYGSRSTNFDKSISGLYPNITYYFRAVAENREDIVYGSILSFNTGSVSVPASNQPTVVIYADQMNLAFNSATTIRWITTNATSCFASGGLIGWAGAKSADSGSFYTGTLTGTRTFTITCSNSVGSSTDSVVVNVRPQTTVAPTPTPKPTPKPAPTSLVLITSSVDSNQPIMPTFDNSRPHPGDEINYTVNYQNIGNASITSLLLKIDLPYEVDYMFSNPSNPIRSGNTLVFNLGTLQANGQGSVTARVRVRENILAGTNLNFPATLSYIDPSGLPQSVTANVFAQIWSEPINVNASLGASVFDAGFLPTNLSGWLLLIILVLILVLIGKYLLFEQSLPFRKQTITVDHHADK